VVTFNTFIDIRLLPARELFIVSQSQQAWIRFVLGIVFTLYIAVHGPYFKSILPVLAVTIPLYLLLNLYSLWWIRRMPYSLPRLLLVPVVDNMLIVMAMWADGGHMSVVYVLLLSPIIGNGFRYGSKMLLYCQLLAMIAMVAISLLTVFHLDLPMDWIGLVAELIGLLYISHYAYSIINKTESTVRARLAAEDSSSRMIAANPHPAFTYDPDKQDAPILFANAAMASLIAVLPQDLVGKPAGHLIINEDRDAFLQALRSCQGDDMHPCYVRLPAVEEEPVQVKCEFTTIHQGGQRIGLCYLTDIRESERLQGELAEARKQAYTAALAAGIAHDFRNMLTGMIGQAELMELQYEDAQLKRDARFIIDAGRRGADMINQLLELGRSESLEHKLVDIAGSISRMLQIARVQLPPDIELHVQIGEGLPKVRANMAQLEQMLLNLIANAAQAMENGRGRIEVLLDACMSHERKGVRLTIRDNGCGITEENLQHIFKPFWSTRKRSGGTGLGMAMVQRIVRWHDGRIDVSSEPGKGTEVCICLPAAGEVDAEILPENMPGLPDETLPEIQPWCVLLVEDQDDVMKIHQEFLTRMGHTVLTAADGEQALRLFCDQRDHIDLVLTDYMMPRMDGLELAERIHMEHPHVQITIITAFGEDDALKVLRLRRVNVLNKPLSYHTLLRHLVQLQQRPT